MSILGFLLRTVPTPFRHILLFTASFLAGPLSASELLIDFVPKAKGIFFVGGPELDLVINFDQEGVASAKISEDSLPIQAFGRCPEVAGQAVRISIKAIGWIDPVTGRDTGKSHATDINAYSALGLGIVSPTDAKGAHKSSLSNYLGRSEGLSFAFEGIALSETVLLTVTEITLSQFDSANDAMMLIKSGGGTFDYLPKSNETLETFDVCNAALNLKLTPHPTPLFSISASGMGSSYRLANLRFEFKTVTAAE